MSYNQEIQFNTGATIKLRWADFKQICLIQKNLQLQFVTQSDSYCIFAIDHNISYVCILILTEFSSEFPFDNDYSQSQNDLDLSDFTTNYKNIANGAISSAVSLHGVPVTPDGRPNIAPNAFPIWASLYFVGRGDDPTLGIGKGSPFVCSSDGYGSTVINWQYNDAIFVLGAIITYTGAQVGDYFDYVIVAPATPLNDGYQPVSLVNIGPGNIIVPDPSGTSTIDLVNTVPVPIPNNSNTGYWDWNQATTGYGSISPNYNQTGGYDLFDFQMEIAHVAVQVPMIGDNQRLEIIIESVTSMELLPQWIHQGTVFNSGHTGLRMGWCFAAARSTSV